MQMGEVADRIRGICARLANEPLDSSTTARYCSELKCATKELAAEQNAWSQASQPDVHQDNARQSYRSRETDSADGFAEGLKLFNPRKPGSEKKKD